eukprot:COSAG05_NODE_812_length_7171_cov_13.392534_5_plen_41_part_00
MSQRVRESERELENGKSRQTNESNKSTVNKKQEDRAEHKK